MFFSDVLAVVASDVLISLIVESLFLVPRLVVADCLKSCIVNGICPFDSCSRRSCLKSRCSQVSCFMSCILRGSCL